MRRSRLRRRGAHSGYGLCSSSALRGGSLPVTAQVCGLGRHAARRRWGVSCRRMREKDLRSFGRPETAKSLFGVSGPRSECGSQANSGPACLYLWRLAKNTVESPHGRGPRRPGPQTQSSPCGVWLLESTAETRAEGLRPAGRPSASKSSGLCTGTAKRAGRRDATSWPRRGPGGAARHRTGLRQGAAAYSVARGLVPPTDLVLAAAGPRGALAHGAAAASPSVCRFSCALLCTAAGS